MPLLGCGPCSDARLTWKEGVRDPTIPKYRTYPPPQPTGARHVNLAGGITTQSRRFQLTLCPSRSRVICRLPLLPPFPNGRHGAFAAQSRVSLESYRHCDARLVRKLPPVPVLVLPS